MGEMVSFAPVVISAPDSSPLKRLRTPRTARHDAPQIEIEAKGIVVRVRRRRSDARRNDASRPCQKTSPPRTP